MLSEKDVALIYETLLTSPGMNDMVKMDLRLPRKNVLLLSKVIENGLQTKSGGQIEGLVRAAGNNTMEELQKISSELLQKAGLADMNEKLCSLQISSTSK